MSSHADRSMTPEASHAATTPLLSVCCIAYNLEAYIGEAIESFLMQRTRFPFEIVIGEDCSSDGTRAVIERYQAEYPDRIRLITGPHNIGLNANFSRTLAACQGQYVAMCDGDDYWTDPGKLQKQVDFLQHNPDVVVVYGAVEARKHGQLVDNFGLAAEVDSDSHRLKYGSPIYTNTACWRNLVQSFPPEYYLTRFNDLFLWSLLSPYGRGKFLGEVGPSVYRLRDDSFFSLQANAKKETMALISNALFISYYESIQDTEAADHFKAVTIKSIIKGVPTTQLLRQLLGRTLREPLRAVRHFFVKLLARKP